MKSLCMGAVWAAVAVAWMGGVARADYSPTEISWPGWRVTSSEDLWMGTRHTSYPLTHLFDGKADTAWVPSGKGKSEIYKGRTVLVLAPEKPIKITSLRLMTGYNKSEALFEKNDRAAEIRIIVNGNNYLGVGLDPKEKPFAKTTRLKDSMGWHKVALDGRAVETLTIEVTGQHKGTTGDLCLSELELYDGDQKIDMHMPEVVRFTAGDECGCGTEWSIIRRDGTPVCGEGSGQLGEAGCEPTWSPTRRYVAAVDYNEKSGKARLCVVEAATGQVILRQPIAAYGCEIGWKGEGFVRVTYYSDEDPPKGPALSRTYKVPASL
jgi:hypothetical protein